MEKIGVVKELARLNDNAFIMPIMAVALEGDDRDKNYKSSVINAINSRLVSGFRAKPEVRHELKNIAILLTFCRDRKIG